MHNSQALFTRLGDIHYRATDALTPYPTNPRKHSSAQVEKVAASIRSFGFTVPILLDGNDCIIAGEARWLAAKRLDLRDVPTIRLDHLTPAQVRAFRIADNRIALDGEWDRETLAAQFEAIIEGGEVEIALTGFEIAEVDVLLGEATAGGADAADPADAVPALEPAVSRSGDLWRLGDHRLICGSSRDARVWARLMDGQTGGMIFSDPPFNVSINGHVSGTGRHSEFAEASGEMSSTEFTDFLQETIGAAAEHLKDGGVADLCMDFRHMPELYAAVDRIGLSVLNLCVWNKTNGGMGSLYRSKYELVLITKQGTAPHTNNVQLGKYGRYRTNVWDYAGANAFGATRDDDLASHPTIKPVALVADAILDVTNPGEIVLDGFMGSGTTLLAAERTRRIGYGVEIAGNYVDVAIRRWEALTGRQAVLDDTRETFAAVRARRQAEVLPRLDDHPPQPRVRHRARAVAVCPPPFAPLARCEWRQP